MSRPAHPADPSTPDTTSAAPATALSAAARALGRQSIALVALCVALSGGTAFAVGQTVAKNTVVSKSIRNGQVKAADVGAGAVGSAAVADGSLTGADVDETTLGAVPSAQSAQTAQSAALGGTARGSYGSTCTPTNTAYQSCATVTITLGRPGALLLMGEVSLSHRNDNQYLAQGLCRIAVDAVVVGGDAWTAKAPDESEAVTSLTRTAPVAGGAHTVTLECKDVYYSRYTHVDLTAVALSNG